MNREIKFRAWDNKNQKWLLGYDYPNLGGFSMFGECILMGEWGHVVTSFMFEKDDKKLSDLRLMQFTGLKDKNGKEIYEGDILKFNNHNCKVIWQSNSCEWMLQQVDTEGKGYMSFEYRYRTDYKIIGNIYENQELLT